jgi:hypothetical protein
VENMQPQCIAELWYQKHWNNSNRSMLQIENYKWTLWYKWLQHLLPGQKMCKVHLNPPNLLDNGKMPLAMEKVHRQYECWMEVMSQCIAEPLVSWNI